MNQQYGSLDNGVSSAAQRRKQSLRKQRSVDCPYEIPEEEAVPTLHQNNVNSDGRECLLNKSHSSINQNGSLNSKDGQILGETCQMRRPKSCHAFSNGVKPMATVVHSVSSDGYTSAKVTPASLSDSNIVSINRSPRSEQCKSIGGTQTVIKSKRAGTTRSQTSAVSFDVGCSGNGNSATTANMVTDARSPDYEVVSCGTIDSEQTPTKCSLCQKIRGLFCKKKDHGEESIYDVEDDPLRKRLTRTFLTVVYISLALIAVFVTYSMVQNLIEAMNHPVRSIKYEQVKDYSAPGIAVYPGGATFLACGHYYNNVVTSKVKLTMLDLENLNCSYNSHTYSDPHYPNVSRDVLVIRGPTSFEKREAIFLHFELEDETRDFFTVSYFVFPGWDQFNISTDDLKTKSLLKYHSYMPTFALSAGLRMWIKLIMSEAYLLDGSVHTEFRVEYSVVRFIDRRPPEEQKKHLFFIFFEWKNDLIEQSHLLYTSSPWSIGAGLCAVFLTLHRGCQLAHISYRKMQKEKRRRRTIKELRRQRSREVSEEHEPKKKSSKIDRFYR